MPTINISVPFETYAPLRGIRMEITRVSMTGALVETRPVGFITLTRVEESSIGSDYPIFVNYLSGYN